MIVKVSWPTDYYYYINVPWIGSKIFLELKADPIFKGRGGFVIFRQFMAIFNLIVYIYT